MLQWFQFALDQIILELEPNTWRCGGQSWSQKNLDAWSWSQSLKFELRLHSPDQNTFMEGQARVVKGTSASPQQNSA